MRLNEECRECLYKSQLKKVERDRGECAKTELLRQEVKKLCQNAPEEWCAPLLMRGIDCVHRRIFGEIIDYSKEKRLFNGILMNMEDRLFAEILNSEYPLKRAIAYAMAANYIDFARLSDLNEDSVGEVVAAAKKSNVDTGAYEHLKKCLSEATSLLYLHDNCGEIVLDKILIRIIKLLYPDIKIYSVVRGGAIINDATLSDAEQTGLGKYACVVTNGTAIPGTYLKEINAETTNLLKSCDVIISKGLGNLETLYGEGFKIFYMFMCKCEHIAARFGCGLWNTAFVYENKAAVKE